MKKLVAHGYKEDLVHLYIIGGGGCLLRHFSDMTEKGNVTVISDICANAKGYEALAEMKQRMRGKLHEENIQIKQRSLLYGG